MCVGGGGGGGGGLGPPIPGSGVWCYRELELVSVDTATWSRHVHTVANGTCDEGKPECCDFDRDTTDSAKGTGTVCGETLRDSNSAGTISLVPQAVSWE